MLIKKYKKGSTIAIVLVMAISVGAIALSYFRFAGTISGNKFRILNKSLSKELAEIAIVEAFNKVAKNSRNVDSKIFETLKNNRGVSLNLELNYANECAVKLLPEGFSASITGSMKVIDFNKHSPSGRKYCGTYEGNGIVSIVVKSLLYKTKGLTHTLVSSYEIEEFHDYIIASAVSMGENGSKLLNSLIVRQNREIGEKDKIKEKKSILNIEKSPDGFQPVLPDKMSFYDEPALWHKRNMTYSELQKQGYIDIYTKTINLSGIVHCCESLTFEGDWKVKGQGVIIANDFNINGGIEKAEPKAICVFYARKNNIVVDTAKKINAALIAINNEHTGTVESKKILNLCGAMVVDKIDITSWPEGDHSISYDRIFKNDDFANRIAVSDWINYRRDNDKLPENI